MSKPKASEVSAALRDIRNLIDTTDDRIVAKIAYTVETAIRWTREDTTDWVPLVDDIKANADWVRDELAR